MPLRDREQVLRGKDWRQRTREKGKEKRKRGEKQMREKSLDVIMSPGGAQVTQINTALVVAWLSDITVARGGSPESGHPHGPRPQ